jgi:adenine deaminase
VVKISINSYAKNYKQILASFRNQPIKIFGTAPAMVSISPTSNGIHLADLNKLLERDDILGLGETYWQAVFQTPDKILPALEATLHAGKVLEGHSAGATGKKLAAYLAAGISSLPAMNPSMKTRPWKDCGPDCM